MVDRARQDDQASGDPAVAFDRLRDEVAMLRGAIGRLTETRERSDVPDYQPTLARTERVLTTLVDQVAAIAGSPAVTVSPETMGQRMHAAVADSVSALRIHAEASRTAFDGAVHELRSAAQSARTADRQDRRVRLVGAGGVAVGLLLYALLAGPIARLAPASWQWPERMATRVLAEPAQWDAGQRLLRTADPARWSGIASAAALVRDNHDAIAACRKTAARTGKAARCSVEVDHE